MEHVVHARGLGRRYGRREALRDVDVDLPAGTIVGLLGPSGAGKTTLVRSLALLLRPSSGTLELFGVPVRTRSLAALRERIAYMPQEPALYEDLTARENVRFFGRGAARRHADELLGALGLAGRAGDPVRTLSGGMKQRVSLACAMVREAALWLLDEPTAGIDPILRAHFWQEFRRARDAGACLLVSTHQIDEAIHCDRLLVLRAGRILADTTPDALLRSGSTTVRLEAPDGSVTQRRFSAGDTALAAWLCGPEGRAAARVEVRNEPLEDILVRRIREAESDA